MHRQGLAQRQAQGRNEIGCDDGTVCGAVHRELQRAAVIDLDRDRNTPPIKAACAEFGGAVLRG
ncbi:hypothetical protein D3C80_2005410 [compost metagenome]